VRLRRLSDEEGRQLQRIVRRGGGTTDKSIVKWRRALVVLASAGGNDVGTIARLVQTSPDRVREMIHAFNDKGMVALDPQWAGGRPRRITTEQRQLIVKTAKKRPRSLGQPFTRWSIRKLAAYLATKKGRKVQVSPERLRQILAEEHITFQRTKTWKESPDPRREENLTRIEYLLSHEWDRTFAFDEFGPLAIKPEGGSCWAEVSRPQRLRANYHKAPRHPAALRFLFGGRRSPLWAQRAPQGCSPHPAGLEGHPSARRRRPTHLRDPRQPEPPPGPHGAHVVPGQRGGTGVHPDVCVVGESDRGALRTAATVHDRQLRLREPRRAGQRHPPLHPLAQHPHP